MSHFNFLEHLFILKQLSCSSGLQPFCLEAAGWMALNWRYLPAKKDNLWGQVESPCPSKSPWFTAEVSVFHQRWRGSSAASGWSVTTAGTTLSTSEHSMSSGRAAALEGAPPAIQTMAQATGRRFSSVASAGLLRLAVRRVLPVSEGKAKTQVF